MDGDASVLPLINVVFLLLVFFMVAGRLSGGDPFEVTPPESGTEGPAATAPMRVLLAADGRLALGTWQGVALAELRERGGARKLIATIARD